MLSEKANLLGSGIGLYVAYHLERYYRQRREVRPPFLPLDTVRGDTIVMHHGRSGGCIGLFPHPTHRSISLRMRRMNLAHNFSHCTTNLKPHPPHCSRRIKPRRVKDARVLGAWRSQTFGMSERSCSALAMTTRMVVRTKAGYALLPHHHYTRRGKMLHKTRNR